MKERRKFVRFSSTNIAELEENNQPVDIQAITKNISQTGACIYSDVYLEPGKYLKVKLYKDEEPYEEDKDALVTWSKLSRDNFGPVYKIGLNIPE